MKNRRIIMGASLVVVTILFVVAGIRSIQTLRHTKEQLDSPEVKQTIEEVIQLEQEVAVEATMEPTMEPVAEPTVEPTMEPTAVPTMEPTAVPTVKPTIKPTITPTVNPTVKPTIKPTIQPTTKPTTAPVEPPKSEVQVPSQGTTKLKLIAHMGLSSKAPANSNAAYRLAGESGTFYGIEADVRETKDGKFVLYHDDNLSTRTNGSGVISGMTADEIRQLILVKGNNISTYSSERVPLLEEYLTICKTYGMRPVLHIKQITTNGRKNLLEQLNQMGLLNQAIITGSKANMIAFRQINKSIELSWICNLAKSSIDTALTYNLSLNSDKSYVTEELVQLAKSKGIEVGAWTVNSKTQIESFRNMGVSFITTDNK